MKRKDVEWLKKWLEEAMRNVHDHYYDVGTAVAVASAAYPPPLED